MPAAECLVYEKLDGRYGGRAERRMKISLRNGMVAGFGCSGYALRYLREYRVEGCELFKIEVCDLCQTQNRLVLSRPARVIVSDVVSTISNECGGFKRRNK